jgi:hypothetical protein
MMMIYDFISLIPTRLFYIFIIVLAAYHTVIVRAKFDVGVVRGVGADFSFYFVSASQF